MEPQKTQYILHKLQQIFQDGYRPARGNESYRTVLPNGIPVAQMVNCLGHVFNLRNRQFIDYAIRPYQIINPDGINSFEAMANPYFTGFMKGNTQFPEVANTMLDFIKETGLRIEECAPDQMITDFKSWKIALYFQNDDFHYLLEDAPQTWSGKVGATTRVRFYNAVTPPKKCHCLLNPHPYHLYGTYKITNPNASETNRYVQEGLAQGCNR